MLGAEQSQVQAALQLLEQVLGSTLLAVYLFGSAAEKSLQPSSDLDLLVVMKEPLRRGDRDLLIPCLLELSAWPATSLLRPLEVTVVALDAIVPWRYPARREWQFGEWLRPELQAGQAEEAVIDSDLAILLSKARSCSVSLFGPPAAQLLPPVPTADLRRACRHALRLWNVPADWAGDERNVLLTLARVWYTLSTGEIASKDDAATWTLSRLPEQHRTVMVKARSAYRGERTDDLSSESQEVAALVGYVRSLLEPLNR